MNLAAMWFNKDTVELDIMQIFGDFVRICHFVLSESLCNLHFSLFPACVSLH